MSQEIAIGVKIGLARQSCVGRALEPRRIQAIGDLADGMINRLEDADRGARILSPRGEAGLQQCFHAVCRIALRVGLPWRKRHRIGCRGQVLELSHHVAQVFVDAIETAELGSGMFDLNRQVADQHFHIGEAPRRRRAHCPRRGWRDRLLELANPLIERRQPLGRIEPRQGLMQALGEIRQSGIQTACGRG